MDQFLACCFPSPSNAVECFRGWIHCPHGECSRHGAQGSRVWPLRFPRSTAAHHAAARSARSARSSNVERLRAVLPEGLGALAANVFGFAPECHHCPPSESNSEVKKGFQGSGLDLALNFVSRPRRSVAVVSQSRDIPAVETKRQPRAKCTRNGRMHWQLIYFVERARRNPLAFLHSK